MDSGMGTVYPRDSNKGFSEFLEGYWVQQNVVEEGWRVQQLIHYEYSNHNEYSSSQWVKNNIIWFENIFSSLTRKAISSISAYPLPRQHTSNIDRSNKRKWLLKKKKKKKKKSGKKQTMSHRNYDWCRLRRWFWTSCNFTTQAESLLQSREQPEVWFGFFV